MIDVPLQLQQAIDERIAHYPAEQKRAPALWLLHMLQEHFGFIQMPHAEWIARRLGIPPMQVWELVTFYPMFTQVPRGRFHVKLCRTLSCEMAGQVPLRDRLLSFLGVALDQVTSDGLFSVSEVECLAACGSGPVVMINDELFPLVTPDAAVALLGRIRETGALPMPPPAPVPAAHPLERRILTARLSRPGYGGTLDEYTADGGYEALRLALTRTPEDIAKDVLDADLKGRGGAGFATGQKWKFLDRKSGKPIYLVCNGDESEPGTFKDRQLLHLDPHCVLEGILLSAYAIGAKHAYLYLRGEFPLAARRMEVAITEARARGLLGSGILGTTFSCEVHVHRGAGAYVCGEETGLIESLEGKRAYPRIKPPFPAAVGLFGCPTVVNNVETLAHVPLIVRHGVAWFKALGVAGSTGTRLVCVSGAVQRPGWFEIEGGKVTFRQLIYDMCGGPRPGRAVRGVIPGGSSMPVLTVDKLDTPIDADSIRKAGSFAGSGGVIVLDDATGIVETSLNLARFYAHESCGQCTPCREGTLWMEKLLHRVHHGGGREGDVETLSDIAANIDGQTICALGEAAAWPIRAFLKNFRGDFESACQGGCGKKGGTPHA